MGRNVFDLPTSVSLRYFWCGGFLIGGFLVLQVVSGVVLSFLYVRDSRLRFGCVLDVTQDRLRG